MPATSPLGWRRWAHTVLTPKVDYMATIRHAVRKALRDSTLGRYDRTYRRPHRRQAAYGEFIMSSFHQPRPRPGFLIDTSSSMQDTQLARADRRARRTDASARLRHRCRRRLLRRGRARREEVFTAAQVELYGGGGTDIGAGLRWFTERRSGPIDLLVIVTDCQTPWPEETPPFPVITIRVGDGAPPPWGDRGANKVITIEEPNAGEDHADVEREAPTMAGVTLPDMRPWGRQAADDSAQLAEMPGSSSRSGSSGWACSCASRSGSASLSSSRLRTASSPSQISPTATRLPRSRCRASGSCIEEARWTPRLPRSVGLMLIGVAAVVSLGAVERGRAEADHRRLPASAATTRSAATGAIRSPGRGRECCGRTASPLSASR